MREPWIVTPQRIEEISAEKQMQNISMKRIGLMCSIILVFQGLNLFHADFWKQPVLWGGTLYLTVVCASFLCVIKIGKKTIAEDAKWISILFWILLSVGMFPFFLKDVENYGEPINCLLFACAMVLLPMLPTRYMIMVFLTSTLVNVAAAFCANELRIFYYAEIVVINVVGLLAARKLQNKCFLFFREKEESYKIRQEQMKLQKKLEKEMLANQVRFDFLTRMSHDLRTPLNGIVSSARLAMDEALAKDEIQHYLHDINCSSEYLLLLINDILDMAKIESNRLQLYMEPYAVDDFVGMMNSVIKEQCSAKHIDFQIMVKGLTVQSLLVDKMRFNQIFLNLLSNAMKFTPENGRIELIVEQLVKEDKLLKLRFTVRDNGIGMSQEFAKKAFEPFSQEKSDDSRRGTGLGLAIVKNIVGLMEGTVRIESAPGKGTAIIIELALREAEQSLESEEKINYDEKLLAGKRILLCEDHPLNTELAVKILEKKDILAETAENGSIGVEMFQKSDIGYYDAVLMDIRMPDMDGLEAAYTIRELKRRDAKTVPIIAMTANSFEEDKQAALKAGMNVHLGKPIEPQILYRVLAEQIGGR